MKNLSVVFVLLALTFSVFGNKTDGHFSADGKEINNTKPQDPVNKALAAIVKNLDVDEIIKIEGERVIGSDVLSNIYKSVNYAPIWQDPQNRADLAKIIEASYYEGLNPEHYHFDFIQNHNAQPGGKDEAYIAAADIIMTDAILSYAYHLIHGKVRIRKLDPNWNFSSREVPEDAEFLLLDKLQTKSLLAGIDEVRSDLPIYDKMRQLFEKYDAINSAGGELPEIEYPGKALRKGDSIPAVADLKQRLKAYDYSFQSSGVIFDEELELALSDFQAMNGLDPDGIAGKKTYKALNISIDDRLDMIRANLERMRWLNNELPDEYVLVNIAGFNLSVLRNEQVDYTCRVVVGKEHTKTPVFTSNIQYAVFNPTWTVPYSIASRETLPKLKKDPDYLKTKNMTLLKGGKVIDPSTVDFKNYSSKNFPYTIRQEPGADNALGLVKFIFPNKFAVYLHDTPSKSYFNRTERAFSHGCIRVQDPLVLAEQLLGGQGYDQLKIEEVVQSEKIHRVDLDKPLPVMIIYLTCVENIDDGKVYFYRDIYGRDKRLLNELKKAR